MLGEQTAELWWPNLFRDMRRRQERLNDIFGGLRFVPRTEFPPVNIWVKPEGVLVTSEIPGVKPEDVDVAVHQDTVTIRGKREPHAMEEGAVVHRQEHMHGEFARTIVLPYRVDADNVSARFSRGVLFLELPRPASDLPRKINVARA